LPKLSFSEAWTLTLQSHKLLILKQGKNCLLFEKYHNFLHFSSENLKAFQFNENTSSSFHINSVEIQTEDTKKPCSLTDDHGYSPNLKQTKRSKGSHCTLF